MTGGYATKLIMETEGFHTFLPGYRDKPQGNPYGYYNKSVTLLSKKWQILLQKQEQFLRKNIFYQ
jgi:hypothetical protein